VKLFLEFVNYRIIEVVYEYFQLEAYFTDTVADHGKAQNQA